MTSEDVAGIMMSLGMTSDDIAKNKDEIEKNADAVAANMMSIG